VIWSYDLAFYDLGHSVYINLNTLNTEESGRPQHLNIIYVTKTLTTINNISNQTETLTAINKIFNIQTKALTTIGNISNNQIETLTTIHSMSNN